jgi:chemotaxis methyl-accepting protein methylase
MNDPRELLAGRIGLRQDRSTQSRLDRAVRQAAAMHSESEAAYAQRLAADPVEVHALIDRVTVQESAFFRHPEHFDLLARHLNEHGGGGLIWSAACGNGQEPWSLAMLLEESGLTGWSVVASDVSRAALARARAGEFAERELRGLSPERRRRFLVPAGGGDHRIADAIRGRVRFVEHNLVDPSPPAEVRRAVIVLCRNVLIYLRRDIVNALLDRLAARMPNDGMLLLGTAETLAPDGRGFRAERLGGVFVHRPSVGPARALPTVPALLDEGERLAAAGLNDAAAASFRKALYLDPEHPLARLRLDRVLREPSA